MWIIFALVEVEEEDVLSKIDRGLEQRAGRSTEIG